MAAPEDLYCEESGCGLPSVPRGAPYLGGTATTLIPGISAPVYFQRWECFGGHRYQIEVRGYRPPTTPRQIGGTGALLYACPNETCPVTSVHVGRGVHAECPECGWTLMNGGQEDDDEGS